MKKFFASIYILFFVISAVLPLVLVHAADDNTYTVLAPLPGTTLTACDQNNPGPECKTDLKTYVEGAFKLAIGISAVAAVFMIVLGGFQYITTDAFLGKKNGIERIKNAVRGLLLVIAAWLILYTINPNLININLEIGKATTSAPTGGGSLSGIASGADLLSGDSLAADKQIRDSLGPVTVNNPPCTPSRPSNCTNLNGLPTSMVLSLKTLQSSCAKENNGSCVVEITGGTESSLHSKGTSHGPGNAVVDLASTDTLNNYLDFPNPKSGDKKTVGDLIFTFEVKGQGGYSTGDHWHVTTK